MKIRSFAAANTQSAMAQVRAEMGEAAVIIAIDETANGRGVVVRAAAHETDNVAKAATVPVHRSIEERLEAFLVARLRATKPLVWRAA